MNLKTFATHTIDIERVKPGFRVLDIGCRDFDFTKEMLKIGADVVHAFDPAKDVVDPKLDRVVFYNCAYVGTGKNGFRFVTNAGNASMIVDRKTPESEPTTCLAHLPLGQFDVMKLDCEGSEYDILLTLPHPYAEQITVEFHEHLKQGMHVHGVDVYERIIKHLGQWYTLVQHDYIPFNGGVNYYDSLWVRK